MNYKVLLLCAIIGASMQNAQGMHDNQAEATEADTAKKIQENHENAEQKVRLSFHHISYGKDERINKEEADKRIKAKYNGEVPAGLKALENLRLRGEGYTTTPISH